MTIFHVLPQFHYINDRTIIGGYPSAVARLAVAQADGGLSVEIVSRMPESSKSRLDGVYLSSLDVIDSASHRHPLRFARGLTAFLRRRLRDGDSIHFHSGHAEYAFVSAILALRFGGGVVHTLYCPLRPGLRGQAQRLAISLARSCGVSFSGMSKNVCNSIPGAAKWTPPVIDTDYFKPALSDVSACQVLFVGNATPSKGLADLLPAYVKIAEKAERDEAIRLVVTTELERTSGGNELSEVFRSLEGAPALAQIRWLSIVSDMRELLLASAIHVAPFRTTNGPSDYFMSTLEAMATGKVCVVSDLPGMAEVITDGYNGFSFRSGDSADLERALWRAIQCDRIVVGGRAREFVVKTFTAEAVKASNRLYGASYA